MTVSRRDLLRSGLIATGTLFLNPAKLLAGYSIDEAYRDLLNEKYDWVYFISNEEKPLEKFRKYNVRRNLSGYSTEYICLKQSKDYRKTYMPILFAGTKDCFKKWQASPRYINAVKITKISDSIIAGNSKLEPQYKLDNIIDDFKSCKYKYIYVATNDKEKFKNIKDLANWTWNSLYSEDIIYHRLRFNRFLEKSKSISFDMSNLHFGDYGRRYDIAKKMGNCTVKQSEIGEVWCFHA